MSHWSLVELVNQTPAVASAIVTGEDESQPRIGLLTAKLTFKFDSSGRTSVDDQDPLPLFETEEETDDGLLPSDAVQRRDPAFEVILLGAAYGPGGRQTSQVNVGLSVGSVQRRMVVTGDRRWLGTGKQAYISKPAPFSRMPLTWDRAFGGQAGAYMDLKTMVTVQDRFNPLGRGFDALAQAELLAQYLEAEAGFPQLPDYTRMLPNLEDPEHLIRNPDDAPEPWCWATIPPGIAFTQRDHIRRLELLHKAGRDLREDPLLPKLVMESLFHRAHPAWIIDLPPAQAKVMMTGVSPEGRLSFVLPAQRVVADYVLGTRTGDRELTPQLLVLLPEQKRFYIVYRTSFTVEVTPELERSFRLRLAPGWSEA